MRNSNKILLLFVLLTISFKLPLANICLAENSYNELHQRLAEVLNDKEFKDRIPEKSFSDKISKLQKEFFLYVMQKIFSHLPIEEAAERSEKYGQYFLYFLKAVLLVITLYTIYQLYKTFGTTLFKKRRNTIFHKDPLSSLNTNIIDEIDLEQLLSKKQYRQILEIIRDKLRNELLENLNEKRSFTDRELVKKFISLGNISLFSEISKLFEEVAFAQNSLDEQRLISFLQTFRAR